MVAADVRIACIDRCKIGWAVRATACACYREGLYTSDQFCIHQINLVPRSSDGLVTSVVAVPPYGV